MSHGILQAPPELVRPDFVFYDYSQGIYKIVRHKCTTPHIHVSREDHNHYDKKLDSSLSRTRRSILELGLCNEWQYFCTFTLAADQYDRKNLKEWHKDFSQWIRDQRKKYAKQGFDLDIKFVLVPEQHKDGSWHMHGLFSDISPVLVSFYRLQKYGYDVPEDLVDDNFYCWFDYWYKFGYCTFGKIKDKVACGFYITKYITKDMQDSAIDVGLHSYYASRPLNRAVKHGEIYGYTSAFDKWLTNHYDFCDTGMTHVKDGCDWSFGMEYMDYDMLEAVSFDDPGAAPEVDTYIDSIYDVLEQQSITGFNF